MGKIYNALNQADAKLETTNLDVAAPRAPSAAPRAGEERLTIVRAEALAESDAIPFIEVGPNKSIEASPGLLDRPAPVWPTPAVRAVNGTSGPAAAPTLAMPARAQIAPELVAFHCPEHAANQAHEKILDALLAGKPADRAAAILFTAAHFGAGTTTILLNLGITAARRQLRVVVVDANLRRPAIAARLKIAEDPGLRDVLAGGVSIGDALQETAQIRLLALTAGGRREDGGVRLVGGTMRTLVRDLRRQFDVVFVDGPRWDGRPDVIAAGVACDRVYVVAPESAADDAQVDQMIQLIPAQGARVGGLILTPASAAA